MNRKVLLATGVTGLLAATIAMSAAPAAACSSVSGTITATPVTFAPGDDIRVGGSGLRQNLGPVDASCGGGPVIAYSGPVDIVLDDPNDAVDTPVTTIGTATATDGEFDATVTVDTALTYRGPARLRVQYPVFPYLGADGTQLYGVPTEVTVVGQATTTTTRPGTSTTATTTTTVVAVQATPRFTG